MARDLAATPDPGMRAQLELAERQYLDLPDDTRALLDQRMTLAGGQLASQAIGCGRRVQPYRTWADTAVKNGVPPPTRTGWVTIAYSSISPARMAAAARVAPRCPWDRHPRS